MARVIRGAGWVVGWAVLTFAFYLLLSWAVGPAPKPMDCRPVGYSAHAWYNPEGQIVAVSPSEDSTLHWVGPCQ